MTPGAKGRASGSGERTPGGAHGDVELAQKHPDTPFDLVPDRSDVGDVHAGGVVEGPLLVALAGEEGAGVAAPHADHDVGSLHDPLAPSADWLSRPTADTGAAAGVSTALTSVVRLVR